MLKQTDRQTDREFLRCTEILSDPFTKPPSAKLFPLHNFQKADCRCQWAFGVGEVWWMIGSNNCIIYITVLLPGGGYGIQQCITGGCQLWPTGGAGVHKELPRRREGRRWNLFWKPLWQFWFFLPRLSSFFVDQLSHNLINNYNHNHNHNHMWENTTYFYINWTG